jgi:hypothetical protein
MMNTKSQKHISGNMYYKMECIFRHFSIPYLTKGKKID